MNSWPSSVFITYVLISDWHRVAEWLRSGGRRATAVARWCIQVCLSGREVAKIRQGRKGAANLEASKHEIDGCEYWSWRRYA